MTWPREYARQIETRALRAQTDVAALVGCLQRARDTVETREIALCAQAELIEAGTQRVGFETLVIPGEGKAQIGDLACRRIVVEFHHKLRDEARYADLDTLVRQIRTDASQARAWFDREPATT